VSPRDRAAAFKPRVAGSSPAGRADDLIQEVGIPKIGHDNSVTTARALLLALVEGHEQEVWEHARALAKDILDDPKNTLAKAILEGGPFAMRKAEELAERVLGEPRDIREGVL
jgi:hypothetical protein